MTCVKFHPISLPHPLWSREPRLDLPLDLGEYHGKFGDVSSYRKQMHKEQADKQTNEQTFFFIYINICSVISSRSLCVLYSNPS